MTPSEYTQSMMDAIHETTCLVGREGMGSLWLTLAGDTVYGAIHAYQNAVIIGIENSIARAAELRASLLV